MIVLTGRRLEREPDAARCCSTWSGRRRGSMPRWLVSIATTPSDDRGSSRVARRCGAVTIARSQLRLCS